MMTSTTGAPRVSVIALGSCRSLVSWRSAAAAPSVSAPIMGVPRSCRRLRLGFGFGQEDLVQRGAPDAHVLGLDAGCVKPPDELGQGDRAGRDRHGQAAALRVDARLVSG